MASKTKVTFVFDVISPYSALAMRTLHGYKQLWNLQIDYHPVFLGGVMTLAENKPPASNPKKAPFAMNDWQRNCRLFDIPYLPTATNFFSEAARKVLTIQRLLVALQMDKLVGEAEFESIVLEFFHSIHISKAYRDEDNNISIGEKMMVDNLTKNTKLSKETIQNLLSKRVAQEDVKSKLSSNTKFAVEEYSCFGVPYLVFDNGDCYFGSDRFEQIANELGKPYYGVNYSKLMALNKGGMAHSSL